MTNYFTPGLTLKRLGKMWFGKSSHVSWYPNKARNTSTWVIGQPGTGKSRWIESQVMQDVMSGRAVGVIDVHGDLFQNILMRIATLAQKSPQLARRVVIVDPTRPAHTATINPLEAIQGQPQERVALFLTDIVIKVWALNPSESPRLVWLLTNTFLALTDLGLSLADLPRWLQDRSWRNQLVPTIQHEDVRRYWEHEFPRGDKEAQVWLSPLTNKLGGILFDSQVRHVVTGQNRLTMRDIMDRGLILLVHLPKGILGERSAFLLGAFVMAQIQKAALSRADTPDREPYYLYADEFQNFCTDYVQDVLAESRKYGLSLVLAHQFLDQLSKEMRSAVLNTSGTVISFRVGYKDARAIAQEIFPNPDFLVKERDDKGGWDKLALELSNLPPREFWVRRRGPYLPAKKRTLDMPDLKRTPAVESAVAQLTQLSGQLYGSAANQGVTTQDPSVRMNLPTALPTATKVIGNPQAPSGGERNQERIIDPISSDRHSTESEELDESTTLYSDVIWDT